MQCSQEVMYSKLLAPPTSHNLLTLGGGAHRPINDVIRSKIVYVLKRLESN